MSDPNFPCDRAIFDAALATARREPLTGPIWWADQVMHHTLYMQSVIHILHAMKLYRHFKNKKYIRHFSEQMAALRGIDLSSTTNSHEALHNTGLTLHIPAEFALQEAALAAFNFTERSFKKGLTLSYNNNDFTISSKNYLLALFKVLKAHGYAMQMLEENTLVVAYHNTSAAKFAEIKSQLFRSLQTIAAQEQILEKVLQLLADTTTHNFSNVEFGYYKTIAADASMNFSYYINLQGLPNLESKAVFIQLLINKNFLNVPVAELVSDENNLIIFEQQHIQLSGIEKSAVTDLKAATPQSQTHRVERADDLAASSRQVTRRVKPQQQQEQAPAIPRPLADEGVELRLPNGLTFFSNPRRRADQPPAERVTPLTFPWHGRNAPLSLAAVEPRLYERLARDQDGRVVTQISNLLAGGVVRGQNAEGNCLRVALVETNDLDGNPQQCVLQVKSVTYNVRLFAPELPARVINQATQEQVDVAFYPFNAIGYGH